jgi:hypothetical protein
MEGERERLRGGPAEPRGDAVAQFARRLPAEREHQDAAGVDAAPLDPVRDRRDDRRGLAGAGAGEDEERSALVVDHPLLRLVKGDRDGRGQRDLAADEPVTVHQDSISPRATDIRARFSRGVQLVLSVPVAPVVPVVPVVPRQRARRMSTRTGGRAERSGVPSARYSRSARASCPSAGVPSAWITRHQGAPPP